ncbi:MULTISPECIES: hypothetical protein [Bacillota]|uniref:hypothetical protein n=1 Tax=Bacillota TaxID=1239 RepID=UPI001356724B|nr:MULTISPECIES: hypothetical protein [Bacillota]MBU3194724.1 hypothetical protein [Clostridium algidicarnis]MBU3207766.1 hypothetical protein [Clostridium algidicarnis]
MLNKKNENKLLQYFGLTSHSEIMDYVRKNPEDEKVKEIKELLKALPINADEEVDRNEK